MDDGSIIGKTADVERAWNMIVEEGPADGLFANKTKSELVWPMRVPESHPFPRTMKVYPTPNCDILGAPIGTPEHCDQWVTNKAVKKSLKLMEHLTKLDAPHHAYLLLRYCLSFSRMVFFLRAIPVDFLPRACDTFDQAVRQGLQAISCYKFDNNALIQSSLRLSNGGLGLRNSKLHHPAAYYASVRQSRDLICSCWIGITCRTTIVHLQDSRQQYLISRWTIHQRNGISQQGSISFRKKLCSTRLMV